MSKQLLFATAAAVTATAASAHEGHGLPGLSHWHPTDAAGLLLAVGAAIGLWWFLRRK